MTKEKSYTSWYFLLGIIILYIITYFFQPEQTFNSLTKTLKIIWKLIPVFVFVIILMAITNYYIKPKFLLKHLGSESGIKGWLVAIIGGMISTGPIFLWLPLLNDLQKKGVKNSLLASFLYNRAIKLPLLPVLVSYLGLLYTSILTVFMILASIIQGIIVEKLLEGEK